MRIYTWQDKYSIDLEGIDSEHQILLGCINKLIAARTMNKQIVLKLADEAMLFGQHHMLSEENLMYLTQYPGLAQHVAEHKQIMDKLKVERRRLDESLDNQQAFISVLVNWFVNHSQGTDRKMAAYINEYKPKKSSPEAIIKSVVTRKGLSEAQ